MIDEMSDKDRDNFYDAIFKSMPEVEAEPWGIAAIKEARKARKNTERWHMRISTGDDVSVSRARPNFHVERC